MQTAVFGSVAVTYDSGRGSCEKVERCKSVQFGALLATSAAEN